MMFFFELLRWFLSYQCEVEVDCVIVVICGYEEGSFEVVFECNFIVDFFCVFGGYGQKSIFVKVFFMYGKMQYFCCMLFGFLVQFFQQVGGCNVVIYYFFILFEEFIGIDYNMLFFLGGVNMIVYFIFVIIFWFIVECVGWRKMFFIGSLGQFFFMVIMFVCFIDGKEMIVCGVVVGLFIYIVFFGVIWFFLFWFYFVEVNFIKIRVKVNVVFICVNWLFNFVIVMVMFIMIFNIGWGIYFFFVVINVCFILVIYFFYFEIVKRFFEEIDIIFVKGYVEKMSYVWVVKELLYLQLEEIEGYVRKYGFVGYGESDSLIEVGIIGDERRDVEKNFSGQSGNMMNSSDEGLFGRGLGLLVVDEGGVESGFGDGVNVSRKVDNQGGL